MNLTETTADHATPRTAAQLRVQAQADYREMVGMTVEAPYGQLITFETPHSEIDRREAAAQRLAVYIAHTLSADVFSGCHNPQQLAESLADTLRELADEAYLELEYAAQDAAHVPAEQPAAALRASA